MRYRTDKNLPRTTAIEVVENYWFLFKVYELPLYLVTPSAMDAFWGAAVTRKNFQRSIMQKKLGNQDSQTFWHFQYGYITKG